MEVKVISSSDPLDLISLEEAKAYLKVDYDNDDDLITDLIKSSFKKAERYTNSSILEKTIEVRAEWEYLRLPYGPIKEVSALSYFDRENTEIDIADFHYQETWVNAVFDTTIPKTSQFKVTYTAGVPVEQVDEDIKTAILKMVYDKYETRGNKVTAAQGVNVGTTDIKLDYKVLLAPFRRVFI